MLLQDHQALLPCFRYHLYLFNNSSPEILYSVDPPSAPSNSNLEQLECGDSYLYLQWKTLQTLGGSCCGPMRTCLCLTFKWLLQFAHLWLTFQQHSAHFCLLSKMVLVTIQSPPGMIWNTVNCLASIPSQWVPSSLSVNQCQSQMVNERGGCSRIS